jgi:hypothetical protein
MLSSGLKYELDALANKDFHYLTKSYLAESSKKSGWSGRQRRRSKLTLTSRLNG